MNQAEFDRTVTQIRRATYDGEFDKALRLLVDLIEKQGQAIEELKTTIKVN